MRADYNIRHIIYLVLMKVKSIYQWLIREFVTERIQYIPMDKESFLDIAILPNVKGFQFSHETKKKNKEPEGCFLRNRKKLESKMHSFRKIWNLGEVFQN